MTFQGLGDTISAGTTLPLTNVQPLNYNPTPVNYLTAAPLATSTTNAPTPTPASTTSTSIIPGIPDMYLYIGGGAVLLILLMMMMKKK